MINFTPNSVYVLSSTHLPTIVLDLFSQHRKSQRALLNNVVVLQELQSSRVRLIPRRLLSELLKVVSSTLDHISSISAINILEWIVLGS